MATATAVNFSVPSVPVAAEATTAQNIAKQRQLHARRQQSATGGLHSLGESFVPFFEEVRGNVREEYEDQESRLQGVEDHIGRIQRALVIEQQRRVEMLKTVKSNLQQQCDEAHAKCRAQLEALRPDIPARIEAWHGRCQAAEEWVAEERILRNKVIDRERLKLLQRVEDFEKQLELERVERLSREVAQIQHVSDEMSMLQESYEGECSRREFTLGHLRDELDQIDSVRDKPDALFKESMVTRMVGANKNIRLETAMRVHAEQNFVEALMSYTKSLQVGLRLVNKKYVPNDPARAARAAAAAAADAMSAVAEEEDAAEGEAEATKDPATPDAQS